MQKELERMKEDAKKKKEIAAQKAKEKYGQYREIIETEFLDTMLKNKRVVCHFYHNDFERCKIMDKHLIKIASEHPETLFVKINAEKTPFLTLGFNLEWNVYKATHKQRNIPVSIFVLEKKKLKSLGGNQKNIIEQLKKLLQNFQNLSIQIY